MAVKLTVVCPSTACPKLKLLASTVADGVKLSLCCVSGNTYGTLWRWLHQVFMSTGVKKIPNAAWKTRPCPGKACDKPKRGAKLCVFGYLRPRGFPFCPPTKTDGVPLLNVRLVLV